LYQPLAHLRFNLFVISETSANKVFFYYSFLLANEDRSHYGLTPGCKVDVQKVPTVVLEFSPGLLRLYAFWHCHDVVPLLPVGLEVFCELHLEASTELHGMLQNSYFHHASETGLAALPENPKTR
jgi:hypothetical protein